MLDSNILLNALATTAVLIQNGLGHVVVVMGRVQRKYAARISTTLRSLSTSSFILSMSSI